MHSIWTPREYCKKYQAEVKKNTQKKTTKLTGGCSIDKLEDNNHQSILI